MNQPFDYQCGECGAIHTEQEWNDHTYAYVTSAYRHDDFFQRWEDDEHFFPLARSIEKKDSSWYHCPSCDEELHAYMILDIIPIRKNFINNKDAKTLLEERY